MPKSVALNGFFPYLRDQAANAVRSARGAATPEQGGGVPANALTSAINGAVLTSAINGQLLTSARSA